MAFDVSKAMREEDPDKERSAAEVARTFEPLLKQQLEQAFEPLRQQLREATRTVGFASTVKRLAEEDRRRRQELVRGLNGFAQAKRLTELAAYDAQVAGMSRQIIEAMNAQVARARIPRIETFRPTLNFVVAEIPYRPQLTPAPDVEVEATLDLQPARPSVPDRERDLVEEIVGNAMGGVIAFLVIQSILWYAQTGQWIFEELLVYVIAAIEHLD
jgi:hypothetical protein